MTFEAGLDIEFFCARGAGDFLGKCNVFCIADCEGFDAEHLAQRVGYARVDVLGGVGKDFIGEVEIWVAQVPDVAAVDAGEVHGEGDEILV